MSSAQLNNRTLAQRPYSLSLQQFIHLYQTYNSVYTRQTQQDKYISTKQMVGNNSQLNNTN
jgi:hypothetical protein